MKKVITISLLVLYSVFSIGLVIHSHYCYNTLYDTSLLGEAKSCCGTNHNDDGGCCRNVASTVKIDDSYDVGNYVVGIQTYLPAMVYEIFTPDYHSVDHDILKSISESSFPYRGKRAIYLVKQVFII